MMARGGSVVARGSSGWRTPEQTVGRIKLQEMYPKILGRPCHCHGFVAGAAQDHGSRYVQHKPREWILVHAWVHSTLTQGRGQ